MPLPFVKTPLAHAHALPVMVPGTSLSLAYTTAQVTANAIGSPVVRLVATTDCFVLFGTAPTALNDGTSIFLPANQPAFFGIDPAHKISALQVSAGGTLYITPGQLA